MTPDWIAKILDVLKSPRLSAVGTMVSALILWFPQRYLPPSAVVPPKYLPWVFLTFGVCSCVLVVSLVEWISKLVAAKVSQRKAQKELLSRLKDLTPDEKHVLLHYVTKNTNTQYLDLESGVVGSLRKKKLVHVGADVRRYWTIAMNIDPSVFKHLREHPELLEGSTEPEQTPTERGSFRNFSR